MKSGWHAKTLGELCDLQNGYAFKSKDYIESSDTLNIRMSNIRPGGFFDPAHNRKFLPDSYAEQYKSFLLFDGDLIIAMTDMAGDPKILGVPTIVRSVNGKKLLMNQRVGKLFNFSNDIHVPFLRYILTSPQIKHYYKKQGAGGLQLNISKKQILSARIMMPLLPVQKQIVSILDEAFGAIAKAKENAARNLANAHELFDSYLNRVFIEKGEGWQEKTLADVCDLQNGYAFKSKDYIDSSDTMNIRMSNIRPGGFFDPDHNKRFLPDNYVVKHQSFLLKEGDLIIAMTDMAGDPKILGVPTLVKGVAGKKLLMNQRVGKLFGFSDEIHVPFLRYFLITSHIRNYYKEQGAGGLQINISKKQILSAKIAMPAIHHQQNLVILLDELRERNSVLESVYQQKLTALDELKQSLLQKAFTGQLTTKSKELEMVP